jgi:hypothetical protein
LDQHDMPSLSAYKLFDKLHHGRFNKKQKNYIIEVNIIFFMMHARYTMLIDKFLTLTKSNTSVWILSNAETGHQETLMSIINMYAKQGYRLDTLALQASMNVGVSAAMISSDIYNRTPRAFDLAFDSVTMQLIYYGQRTNTNDDVIVVYLRDLYPEHCSYHANFRSDTVSMAYDDKYMQLRLQ